MKLKNILDMTCIITFFLSDMQKTMGNIKANFTSKQCLVINCYQICVFKNNLNFQIHFNCSLHIEYNSVSEIHSQLPSTWIICGYRWEVGKEGGLDPPPLPFRKIQILLNLHYKIINNVDCTPLSKLRYPSYLLKKPRSVNVNFNY